MKTIVVSRSEARSGTVKRASIPCGNGNRTIPVRVPAGVRNKQSIRIRRERLPPDAERPADGFTFPVRVYDRRALHAAVGVVVVAGLLGHAAVDRLRTTMQDSGGATRRAAAHSIFELQPSMPLEISAAQGRAAGGICGCRWVRL